MTDTKNKTEGISITGAMQITYRSDDFGKTFWLDNYADMMATASFIDGGCDYENAEYVSDWEEVDEDTNVALNHIKKELTKAHIFVGNLPRYIQEPKTLENLYTNN